MGSPPPDSNAGIVSPDFRGLPILGIAVILAAAVSSIPDTFMSLGSPLRGDDTGATSNAFGSKVFDKPERLAVIAPC